MHTNCCSGHHWMSDLGVVCLLLGGVCLLGGCLLEGVFLLADVPTLGGGVGGLPTRGVTTSRGSALHPPPRTDYIHIPPGWTKLLWDGPWDQRQELTSYTPMWTEWQTLVKTLPSLEVGNNEGFETRWVLFFNINPGKAL